MNDEPKLTAQPAVATMQVQIIRAKTGKVEDYTLTFTADEPKEADDGRDSHDDLSQHGS